MAHEVETMAWAHEVPWHGLGNKVEGNLTVDEMLVAAGLDWEVQPIKCFAEVDGERIPVDRNALIRSSDKKVLTITGPEWKPLQNRDALDFFREYTEAGGATLETAGALKGGKVIWGLARVATGFTINGNDSVKGYILLTSPHQVGQSITVRTTSVRVVCANTLALASRGRAEYRQSHIKDFNVSAARETVKLVKDQIEQMKMEAEALNSLKMSEYDTVRFLADFFQPDFSGSDEDTTALVNAPEAQHFNLQGALWATSKAPGATPGTAWGVLNGITYWADHMAGRSKDARLFNSWLGSTYNTKDEARQKLLEMV